MNVRATVAVPGLTVGFDDLAAAATVDKWVDTGAGLEDRADRQKFTALRARFATPFATMRALPMAGAAMVIVNGYVQECVPVPKATEGSFWALSCLPATNSTPDFVRLATLTVDRTEMLWLAQAIGSDGAPTLAGCLAVSRTALAATAGDLAAAEYDRDLVSLSPAEDPSGDALAVHFVGVEGYLALDQLEGIDRAARALVVTLMRRGRTGYAEYHCPDLADWATRELTDDEADALLGAPGNAT